MVQRNKKHEGEAYKEADKLAEELAQIRRENEVLRATYVRLEDKLERIGPIEMPSYLLPEPARRHAGRKKCGGIKTNKTRSR